MKKKTVKIFKKMTVGHSRDVKESFQDLIEQIMGTKLKGCLNENCSEYSRNGCLLRYMSIGTLGECTFYTEKKK